ncbi:MAG: preprotein translocase subunit Sec61beta [Candidatus Aenigmatarchaeota archaeon]|nr:MAG: preprotein translocase subunit Sec61beta [Candidatus Aenigmarchaeota archaeon]
MAKDKRRMPQSTAGLINYSEEVEDGINLKPEIVLGIGFGICILVLVLRFVV